MSKGRWILLNEMTDSDIEKVLTAARDLLMNTEPFGDKVYVIPKEARDELSKALWKP